MNKLLSVIFGLFSLFAYTGFAQRAEHLKINFIEEVELNEAYIEFQDVADISGPGADSLKTIVLGKTAGYGRTRYLSTWPVYVRYIKKLENEVKVDYNAPTRVKVTTSYIPVKQDTIHSLLEAYFESYNKSNKHYEYDLVHAPKNLKIPDEKTVLKLLRQAKGEFRGTQKFSLQVYNKSKLLRSYPFKIYVREFDSVWVALDKINRGSEIKTTMLQKEWKDVTRVSGEIIKELALLENCMVRQTIISGRVLTHNLFTAIPIVEMGDEVKVESNTDGIQITLNGIAREDGALGDVIRVKNLISLKIIKAKIIESGKLLLVSNSPGG